MINYQEALSIILKQSASFGEENIFIDEALDRVLAEDILSDRDLPPFNRSAMDGIALNFMDLENGIREFNLVETIFAGQASTKKINTAECYKIMTGAAVPNGANVVIRIEDILYHDQVFKVLTDDFGVFQNIALKGQDLQQHSIALQKGELLNIPKIGLLASLGKTHLLVKKLPTVNVITTGNEVVELGTEISPFHIYNCNKHVLKQLIRQNQIKNFRFSHADDDLEILKKCILENLETDILILTGGVSAGDADYIPEVLADLGVKQIFHKVAIKPGKPLYVGVLTSGTMVFALPGNPFSCLITFKLFVEYYIKSCLGLARKQQIKLSGEARKSKSKFDEFFPVRLINNDRFVTSSAINGSGDVRLGFSADGFAMHPKNKADLIEKDEVLYFPF